MKESVVHTCANGLQALVWQRTGAAVVSVQVWVETGSMVEGAYAGSGISHLLEHMVFKGTEEYSASEFGEAVSALGGLWNAYTSTDRTVFHIEGPAIHCEEFVHILAQLVLHPTFPADEWEREREVIRREMDMYRDDPNDASYRALIETLFKKHPRRLPIIGERAVFDALTLQDMQSYHAERYVPGNMFLCVAGDVDPEKVIMAAEREFGSAVGRTPQLPSLPVEPRQWGPRVHRCEFAQSTSTLMLAWRIPCSQHPDTAALALLSCILGDGRAAWLYKAFHDEQAMAHDIATMIIPHMGGEGAFVIEADVERARRDELRDALLRWLETLPQADFEESLRRALRQQKVRRLRAISTVQGAADMLGSFWHSSRNTNAWEEWRSALCRVSQQDLRRVAAEWLSPERLTEVSVDPSGSNIAEHEEQSCAAPCKISEFSLPNGLRCVLRADKRLPIVHAALAVKAGCRVEQADNAGICSLLAECMPKGTTTRSAAQIADSVEEMGGSLHCVAGNNVLMLTLHSLAEEMPNMLELLADVALRPIFPQEAVLTAREDIVADIQEDEQNPVSCAFRRLRKLCFGAVSYGNPPGGEVGSVSSLTREDVVRMHERLMCGENAVLSIAGDIEPEEVKSRISEFFACMATGAPPALAETPQQNPADAQMPAPCEKEQAVLALAMPSLPLGHEEMPLLLLLDEWCQDMAGPIYTEIREKRGLAYHASSSLLQGADAGCLFFSLETSPELLPQARAALDATLERLAEEGIPPAALESARATALASRMLASQSIGKICSGTAVDTLLGLGADCAERTIERLLQVQHEQMQSFIRRLLARDAVRTYITLLPEGS